MSSITRLLTSHTFKLCKMSMKTQGNVCSGLLTIRPPHGVIQLVWQTFPQAAVFRVTQVHTSQVVIVAPVVVVLEEVGFIVV